jgi:surface antigen
MANSKQIIFRIDKICCGYVTGLWDEQERQASMRANDLHQTDHRAWRSAVIVFPSMRIHPRMIQARRGKVQGSEKALTEWKRRGSRLTEHLLALEVLALAMAPPPVHEASTWLTWSELRPQRVWRRVVMNASTTHGEPQYFRSQTYTCTLGCRQREVEDPRTRQDHHSLLIK